MKVYLRQISELVQSLSSDELKQLNKVAVFSSPKLGNLLKLIQISPKNLLEDNILFFQKHNIPLDGSDQLLSEAMEFILQFLRSNLNTPYYEVLNAIENIKILFKREQKNLCLTILENAKKIAQENDFLAQLVTLTSWEKALKEKTASEFELKVLSREQIQSKQKHINQLQYSTLISKVVELKGGFIQKSNQIQKAKALLKHPLLQNESCALTLKAKIDYHYILGLIHHHIYNYALAKAHTQQILTLMKQHPSYTQRNIFQYMAIINNYSFATLCLDEYEETLNASNKLKNILQEYTLEIQLNLKESILLRAYHIDIQVYKKQLQLKKAEDLIPKIMEAMNSLTTSVPIMHQTGILYEVAETLFFVKDYHKALAYTQKVYQYDRDRSYVDAQIMSRLLELLIYVELDDKSLLNKRLEVVKDYLKNEKAYFRYEVLLLDLMKKILCVHNETDKQQLYTEYLMLFRSIENLIQKDAYLDMTVWLESKLENKDFTQVLAEKSLLKQTVGEKQLLEEDIHLNKGLRAQNTN